MPKNSSQQKTASQETVILLHGLGRTALSMRKLQNELEKDYFVINQSYPSQKYSIAKLAEITIAPLAEKHSNASKIHFVTHSLGGILVRQYCQQHKPENLGNTVMIGPPNQGSELADFFQKMALYRFINGPAGAQLGTDNQSIPNLLGKVNFPVGVIAGNRSFNPLYSLLIDGADDGKVSVKRSKIAGMKDHITLPVSHTFMMRNPQTVNQVKHFLQHSTFNKDM